jgi:hypothetical protein
VEDVDVKGLHIPKDMLITLPVYSVHTDPDYWPDSFKFDPERCVFIVIVAMARAVNEKEWGLGAGAYV